MSARDRLKAAVLESIHIGRHEKGSMLQIASLRDSISLQKSLNVKEKQESEDNQGAIEKKIEVLQRRLS